MNGAALIAAIGAEGARALDETERREIEAICTRTGLQMVRLDGECTVTHAPGYGPNVDDNSLCIYELPQTTLVSLGICISLCRDEQAGFPSRRTSVEEFDQAVALLLERRGSHLDSQMRMRHLKGALPDLAEMGYLKVFGEEIRLGPALAAWSEGDWAMLPAIDELLESQ